jgi:hypothetical protein
MNKRYLVFGAAVAMLLLIAGAFVVDCVRLGEAARRRVELADEELAKHEQRLVKLIIGTGLMTDEVKAAINAYLAAEATPERHEAYEKVVGAFRQTMQADFDATDPLDRKFMDDVAGAINRRERAEPPYEAEAATYREYMRGVRGGVARWAAAERHADLEPKSSGARPAR